MKCKHCGGQNPEGAKYCGYCQHGLETEKRVKKKHVLITSALLLCMLFVFLGSLLVKQDSHQIQECQHEWENSGGEISICKKCKSSKFFSDEGKSIEAPENKHEDIASRQNQLCENGISFAIDLLKKENHREEINLRSITFLNTVEDVPSEGFVDVSAGQDGSVLAWLVEEDNLYIAANGDIIAPENCEELFACNGVLEEIRFNGCFDTSNVTNMSWMFDCCMGLQELDLSLLDTSSVIDMTAMFSKTMNLKKLDVSTFDTSSVTTMSCMFYNSGIEEVNLSGFNTSNVTDMSGMFEKCQYLKRLDLSNFTTSDETNVTAMFYQCYSLEELDIRGFDLSGIPQEDIPGVLFMDYSVPKLFITNSNLMESKGTHYKTLSGDWSSERIAVGGTNCYPWIFDEIVENCTGFTMHYQITDVYYGKVYGTYGLYRKTLNNNWERVATFEVSDQSEIIKTFEFDEAISFTQLAVAAPAGRSFNFDSILWFEDWYLQD